VRILLMPAPHKDVSDWIAAGGTPAQLLALVETAAVPAEAASSAPPQEAPEPQPADLTEDGVALAFAAAHAGRVVFDHTERRWAEWDGSRWRRDGKERVFDGVRAYVRRIRESVDEAPRSLARMGFAAAVERGVRADQRIAVEHDVWDADPWALGVPGGVVDLRTGTLRAGRPEQYISRQTSVAPTERVDCPRWLQFMDEVTAGDAELTRFLRQWGGYCLTGDTREEALLFMYGPGGNGKGKFLSAMQGILGDYCCTAAMETFTASGGDKHPTDLAMLRGARMVCASETDEGRAWAEVRIKQMTGNDVISARFMRQDFFQYRPQFKLTIIGNHKPVLRNVDDAARRRFNIVPFNFKPPRPDLELEAKLKAERPGILRWMIEGCLDWQANGLIRPQVVVDATAEYFEAQDLLAHWLTERCQEQATAEAASSALYRDWSGWARDRGEEPGTNKAFSAAMERRHPKRRTKTGAVFLGLRLRPSEGGVW
jgi:putative DNA primase/helicase